MAELRPAALRQTRRCKDDAARPLAGGFQGREAYNLAVDGIWVACRKMPGRPRQGNAEPVGLSEFHALVERIGATRGIAETSDQRNVTTLEGEDGLPIILSLIHI